ncbi:putative hydrolase [Xylariaceae sp. FL0255]|nr:putative hydrolase [Xylariaceae sp. FL0255]
MSPRFTLKTALLFLTVGLSKACFEEGAHLEVDWKAITAHNNEFRSTRRHIAPKAGVTAIENVRVFDGYSVLPVSTVFIQGDKIIDCPQHACNVSDHIDGNGRVLLPGLIDAHAHPGNVTQLQTLSQYGVTTTALMACYFVEACRSLTNQTGLADVIVGSIPAAAPGSAHGNITKAVDGNGSQLVYNSTQALEWLDTQLAWKPDFVKLVAESLGLDQETLNVLTQHSHENNKPVACHASAHEAWVQAVTAGVDSVQHTPLDTPISLRLAESMICRRQVATPTLTIMKAISIKYPGRYNYTAAQESVRILHSAGVPILAGTDANEVPGIIANVPFGSSIHQELQLLVQAGLDPAVALRAATSIAAKHWGLHNRGVIATGKRADLLLISGNPLENISATQNIQKIWVGGIEYEGVIGTF